ncbi:MAG TPA: YeeE/YedE thiosulfate transporter family protein [Azospirillum sp.]|nr:YeeE/YedE thiosulfate transporter family protein [Azospirillum sp.]
MPYGLRDKAWSPYAAGVLIGLLQIPAFLLINTALGASSSYVTVAAHLASLADPAVGGIRYAAQHMEGAKNWWQVAMVAGIALGAFASSRLSGTRRRGFSPIWTRVAGVRSLGGRVLMGTAGGFVMLLGARIADGCTSGHGISGLAQLSVGSFIAVGAMFAGGILAAALMKRI